MNRRKFIIAGGGALSLAGCHKLRLFESTPTIRNPGMREGHFLRDFSQAPAPSYERSVDVAVLGSGVAGLSTAWQLARNGYRNFVVVSGPEFGGNSADGSVGRMCYPTGAHYLPLPSLESSHVREMLQDLGVLLDGAQTLTPYYDERMVVHAPDERLYFNGKWQEGLVPTPSSNDERSQYRRFFLLTNALKSAIGADGKRAFAVPIARASRDPKFAALDSITFAQWLQQEGFHAPTLLWYLSYCCRDDFGATPDRISAWAGLHYFAGRGGLARNAAEGAVLTWPNGLGYLINKLQQHISTAVTRNPIDTRDQGMVPWRCNAFVLKVTPSNPGVSVLCGEIADGSLRAFVIKAKRVVCAMPLFVAAKVLANIKTYGFDPSVDLPTYTPWLVGNFVLDRFPVEPDHTSLAWDNVVYGSRALGYVVGTHQYIRVAKPPRTVFTTYQALSSQTPRDARTWLTSATAAELLDEASCDLDQVYGQPLGLHVRAVEITVRGHAMASPTPSFRNNAGRTALQLVDSDILFAHSDLSGYSVFEEASWWGVRAANLILGYGAPQ